MFFEACRVHAAADGDIFETVAVEVRAAGNRDPEGSAFVIDDLKALVEVQVFDIEIGGETGRTPEDDVYSARVVGVGNRARR